MIETRERIVMGVDTGRLTGWSVVDASGNIRMSGTLKLEKLSVLKRALASVDFVRTMIENLNDETAKFGGIDYVAIEDISKSHSTGARAGADKRTSHSIASVQRDFAMLVALFYREIGRDLILAPVAKWYPRDGGCMMKKAVAREHLRRWAVQTCGIRPRNEHECMAYGIARWAHGEIRLRARLIR